MQAHSWGALPLLLGRALQLCGVTCGAAFSSECLEGTSLGIVRILKLHTTEKFLRTPMVEVNALAQGVLRRSLQWPWLSYIQSPDWKAESLSLSYRHPACQHWRGQTLPWTIRKYPSSAAETWDSTLSAITQGEQSFVWDTASQSSKWLDIPKILGDHVPLASLATSMVPILTYGHESWPICGRAKCLISCHVSCRSSGT